MTAPLWEDLAVEKVSSGPFITADLSISFF